MTVTVEHGAESVKLGALVTHYWAVLDREEETA